ncbi:MAG: hypothetical protein KGQ60_14965, partial [Planctomycetes bacterium]|nr:hypothetical protein [Planctomycetota bacterium]
LILRGPAPGTPGIFFGMTRVFKVHSGCRLLLSGETEASSAGTQLVEGYQAFEGDNLHFLVHTGPSVRSEASERPVGNSIDRRNAARF